MVEVLTKFPPWRITGIKICTSMFHVRKSKIGASAARALFLDHLTFHNEYYCPDRSQNELGIFFVVQGDNIVLKKLLLTASSYAAELNAILAALVACRFAPTYRVRNHRVWLSQCTPEYT
ncbi:hypothetical protein FHG87_005934 [Trinorchestia longiramus]|nr:hypothetical protein FHG87_005934 [Trinorchestia longiramus]